jgi:arabinofuranosyltransferase
VRWWTCLLIGLGPLVRPDLLIMTIAFLGILLVVESSWRQRVRVTAWIVALPVAYEVFRMAYYAALIPNSALAKEAGTSDWSRGWTYFTDFLGTYQWWIPVGLLLVVALVPLLRSEPVSGSRELTVLVVAPLVAGIVHAVYVIRVGGDFMHARMLLPSLWCFLLPGTVVVVRTWRWAGAAALAAWVVVCGLFLRVGYVVYDTTSDTTVNAEIGPSNSHALITNERGEFVEFSNNENPVTLDDYRTAFFPFVRAGEAARQLAANGKRGVLLEGYKPDSELLPIRRGLVTPPIVSFVENIGMYGYAAGPDVDVVDVLGIADPLGSRLRVERGTPGHEKRINPAWQVARFVDPSAGPQSRAVRDARRALQCRDLRELLHDVSAQLDAEQAWDNFWDSFSLTSLRIARSPSVAVRELCD